MIELGGYKIAVEGAYVVVINLKKEVLKIRVSAVLGAIRILFDERPPKPKDE